MYVSQFWRLGSPRSRHQQTWCLVRSLFMVFGGSLPIVSSHGQERDRYWRETETKRERSREAETQGQRTKRGRRSQRKHTWNSKYLQVVPNLSWGIKEETCKQDKGEEMFLNWWDCLKLKKQISVHVKRVYRKSNKISEGKNYMISSSHYQKATYRNPLTKN